MTQPDLSGPSFNHLSPKQQDKLRTWLSTVEAKEPMGLWIFGNRDAGSSYVATVAVKRVVSGVTPMVGTWERLAAMELIEHIRKVWSFSGQVRAHQDDWGLHLEMQHWEQQLDFIWRTCELLWIDNFHHDYVVDLSFWKKYIQPHLELRHEKRLITVVSTTLAPQDEALPGLNVMQKYFIPVPVLPNAGR